MALKIIGAGFGRTGTMSLKLALEQLGLGPCHHMKEVIGSPEQTRLWSEAAAGRPDFDRIFAGYAAAVDWPVAAFWPQVAAHWPEAKVILSTRSAESWYDSFSHTILSIVLDRSQWPDQARPWFEMIEEVILRRSLYGRSDRAGVLAAFVANEAAVRTTLPADRLLVFRASDGWAPLCGFLGLPVPEAPYPRTNAKEDFFATVRSGVDA